MKKILLIDFDLYKGTNLKVTLRKRAKTSKIDDSVNLEELCNKSKRLRPNDELIKKTIVEHGVVEWIQSVFN